MQGMGNILCRFNHFLLFDIPQHFRRCFGTWRHHEVVGQAINHFLLAGFSDVVGRLEQRHGTRRGGGAKTSADLAFGVRLQQVAVHIAGATTHRGTGHNVLGNRFFHESGRGVDFYFASLHVGFINHAADAAVVVNMAVGEQDGDNRLFTAVGVVEIHRFFRRLGAQQRVDNGDPFLAFDDGHVGEIEITDLINTVGDFKQAADINQL